MNNKKNLRRAMIEMMEMGLSKQEAIKKLVDLYHVRLKSAPVGSPIEEKVLEGIGLLYELLTEK